MLKEDITPLASLSHAFSTMKVPMRGEICGLDWVYFQRQIVWRREVAVLNVIILLRIVYVCRRMTRSCTCQHLRTWGAKSEPPPLQWPVFQSPWSSCDLIMIQWSKYILRYKIQKQRSFVLMSCLFLPWLWVIIVIAWSTGYEGRSVK